MKRTAFLLTSLALGFGAAVPSFAEPPPIGEMVHAGTQAIVCLKDVAGDTYKGLSKASEVKPRLDALFAEKVCGIIVIPVNLNVIEVKKVGYIATDLSDPASHDDVYSLTAGTQDDHVYVLWAETSVPSI